MRSEINDMESLKRFGSATPAIVALGGGVAGLTVVIQLREIRGIRLAIRGRRLLAAVLLGFGLGTVSQASAQTSDNPAATINGTVPTSEGNIWGGLAHQPTEAQVPELPPLQREQLNNTLQTLAQKLLNEKLPKVPKSAPPVSSTRNH
jgi:hypothetical protein